MATAAAAARRVALAPLRLHARPTSCLRAQQRYLNANQTAGVLQRRGFAATSLRAEKWYSEEHEWIDISEDGKHGTIGITTYAAKSLGDVVFVELPAADLEVGPGDALGAVESVKSASDIYAPAGGKVVAINSVLEDAPGTINKSPEADGWIAKLELAEGEVERIKGELMDAAGYGKFTDE